jgi:hypothetical protein
VGENCFEMSGGILLLAFDKHAHIFWTNEDYLNAGSVLLFCH